MATCRSKISELLTNKKNKSHSKQRLLYESLVPHMFRSFTHVFMPENHKKKFRDSDFFNIVIASRMSRVPSPYRTLHDKQRTQVPHEPSITKASLATTTDRALTR